MFDLSQILTFGPEIGQIVKTLFVPFDGVGQTAFVPGPAREDLRAVFFQSRRDLFRGYGHVAADFVGVQ